jgi:hypothetical protein
MVDPDEWKTCPCPSCNQARRWAWWLVRTPLLPLRWFAGYLAVWIIVVIPATLAVPLPIVAGLQFASLLVLQYTWACRFHRDWLRQRRERL